MGLENMMPNSFDADSARYNRRNRTTKPDFQPGMNPEESMDLFSNTPSNDLFNNSAQSVNTGGVGDIFSSGVSSPSFNQPMNGDGGVGIFGPQGGVIQPFMNGMPNPQQQPQMKSDEDRIWEAMASGGKASMNFFKDFIDSFHSLSALFWVNYGRYLMIAGGTVAGVSLLFRLIGWKGGLYLCISGLISTTFGVGALFFNMDNVKNNGLVDEYSNNGVGSQVSPQGSPQSQIDMFSGMSDDNDFTSSIQDNDDLFDDSWNNDDSFDNTQSQDFGGDDEDFDFGDDDWELDDTEAVTQNTAMSAEDALKSIPDIPVGMYTRQFLWDTFVKVLPDMNNSFDKFNIIDEDDDVFAYWYEQLQDAGAVSGMKEEDLEELNLLELKENMFTVIMTTTRPKGYKPEVVGQELARIYSYQDGEFKDGIFSQVDNVGTKSIITIFTGASKMISLKDMMMQQKDYILDAKHVMPIVFGVNQRGKVIVYDFKILESILITGMPRSGKSWFAVAVITQMCAFMSPKDLNIYIGDAKGGTSTYIDFKLPHIKGFADTDEGIVDLVRKIVRKEADKRASTLAKAGCKSIWEFREKCPDVEFPVIYILIDEVVTLAERMEKEIKAEFQGYLVELITRLPSYGIRAILIPHVIKDQVIKKTATDTIPCRISVKGAPDHVETVTGAKPKDFPYKLTKKGDMAVRVPDINDKVMYLKAPVLTATDEENKILFDYMRRYWLKLMPECDKSNNKASETNSENSEFLNNLDLDNYNLDNIDDLGFGDLFNQ